MSNQLTLLNPGQGGRETPSVQERLLARREDPVTSKTAARTMVESGKLTEQQKWAWLLVKTYCEVHGSGTARELTYSDRSYFPLCRRLPELERLGLVRVQQDPSKLCRCKPDATRCRCRDVVRDGSRVWEVCE